MIKAVIFDMDGLMFDTIPIWDKVMIELLGNYGAEFNQEVKSNIYSVRQDECVKYFIKRFSLSKQPQELMEEMGQIFKKLAKSVQPYPGLYELLDFLEKLGVEKAIATTSLRKDASVLLAGDKHRFKDIIYGDDVKRAKPAPDAYLKLIKRLGYLPEECIGLEDSLNGAKSSKSSGCFTIAVPNEHSREVDFTGVADLVVKNLFEVKDYICKKLNKKPERDFGF